MGTLAEFDSVSPPPVPRCIAHIAKYSDMWRHFDRGFYNFLRRCGSFTNIANTY